MWRRDKSEPSTVRRGYKASSQNVKPTQKLAALLDAHQAFSKPARDSLRLRRVQPQRPLTGARTVLPVLRTDVPGASGNVRRWPRRLGEFFVEEAISLRATDVGAPFALALSARSNVLQQFAGGPGQIALHGLRNIGGVLGTAVSHGCVRLDNGTMRWLVLRIGPGVPVTVTR